MSIYYSFSSGRQQIGAAVGHDIPFSVARDQEVVIESRIPDSELRTIAVSGGAETIELVEAQTGRVIELNHYTLIADTTTSIKFLSGSSPLSGSMVIGETGGISSTESKLLVTGSGEALNLVNASGNIGGHISYRIV